MKTKYLFLFLLFRLHHCIGQEEGKEVTYFVMAYVFNNDEYLNDKLVSDAENRDSTYRCLLYRINKDSFITIDTLSSELGFITFLTDVSKQKFLYFDESNEGEVKCSSIFDYSYKFNKKHLRIARDITNRSIFSPPMIINKNDTIIIYNKLNSRNQFYINNAWNRNFEKVIFHIQDFENIYNEGVSGFQKVGQYANDYYYNKKTKKLNYWRNDDGDDMETKIQIDKSFFPGYTKDINILISNSDYFVGRFVNQTPNYNDTIGDGVIFNKKTKVWQKFDIPGINPRIKIWGNWILGTRRTRDNLKWYDVEIAKRLSKRYDLTFGKVPDITIYPGILYLYNIPTKKLIKWYPGDRDSEIITIHEGIIYYRVFDEIRTVELDTIKNEINWPSQKLLIKNKKRVPNIHWMFFAPKQDKVEEVWVNRPKGIKE